MWGRWRPGRVRTRRSPRRWWRSAPSHHGGPALSGKRPNKHTLCDPFNSNVVLGTVPPAQRGVWLMWDCRVTRVLLVCDWCGTSVWLVCYSFVTGVGLVCDVPAAPQSVWGDHTDRWCSQRWCCVSGSRDCPSHRAPLHPENTMKHSPSLSPSSRFSLFSLVYLFIVLSPLRRSSGHLQLTNQHLCIVLMTPKHHSIEDVSTTIIYTYTHYIPLSQLQS
jgi:hypothetical protein